MTSNVLAHTAGHQIVVAPQKLGLWVNSDMGYHLSAGVSSGKKSPAWPGRIGGDVRQAE